jgi:hypothetical protein
MPGRPKASWASYKLIRSILTADEEYSIPHCLDSEAEKFVVVLEESQKATQRACTPKYVDVRGVEMRVLHEHGFNCWLHRVTWMPSCIRVFEVFPRVLWQLLRFWRWVP